MNVTSLKNIKGNTDVSEEERKGRKDLAAAFRLMVRNELHEGVANHLSLAVSEDGSKFLINPDSRHFSRITASELLLIDANDPTTLDQPNAPDRTAWGLHGAVHRNAPHARCVLHAHPTYATVIASLKDSSIPPIDQNTMRFFNRVAIDENFGGMALDDEAERACSLLGNHSVLMMGNHGVLVVGPTVAQAYDELFYLERACRNLVLAYSTGRELKVVSDEVARKTCQQWHDYSDIGRKHFEAMCGILDEEEPDYKD